MKFKEAKALVEERSKKQWDGYHPPSQMTFHDFNSLTIGNTVFRITRSAKKLLGQRLGIPVLYIDRCPPELQAVNLNHWLAELNQSSELFCRFEENALRAVFTGRYKPMDHHDILQQLDVPDGVDCIFRIDHEMMQLSIPNPAGRFTIGNDDEIMPGFSIINSEVGIKSLVLGAYYYRIVCTNGMLATDIISQKFRHTSTKALDNFSSMMDQAVRKAIQYSDRFKLAADQHVEDPPALIQSFGRQFQLTNKESELVQSQYLPPDTMWSVINAFTAAANDFSLSVEKSAQLQFIGGKILTMVK